MVVAAACYISFSLYFSDKAFFRFVTIHVNKPGLFARALIISIVGHTSLMKSLLKLVQPQHLIIAGVSHYALIRTLLAFRDRAQH